MRRWLGGSMVITSVLIAACGGGGDAQLVQPPAGTPAPTPTPAPRPTPGPTPSPAPSPSPGPAPVGSPPVGTALNEATCALQYTYAEPTPSSGADPRLGEQWHLVNTGQSGGTAGEDLDVVPVWSQALGTGTNKGDGVRIAVVDDSLEVTHEDLVPNVPAGQSFNYRAAKRGNAFPLPCLVDDDHGTAVGGIIAARDGNAVGVAGVAPRSALVGYNALATGTDADIADALTRALDGNQIYHNSWGSSDNGIASPAERSFIDAIEHGIANGRQGKGSVYVFSAGNGGCYVFAFNGDCLFDDNSNFDGYVNKKGVIAVCAVDDRGRSPFYAEPGANVLLCAPSGGATSGITTTYVLNAYRPGPNNDPGAFSGTSASAPMVSGVVALMLAANPALTWRDVRVVLARSARRNDPLSAGWVTHVGDGFTYHHHPNYGFGVVDAQAAVALAKTWSTIGGSQSLVACEKAAWTRTVNAALPDAPAVGSPTTVSDTVTVADADCAIRKIEFVEITLKTTHAYTGDLRVKLVSPNGLASELAVERQCGGSVDACGPFDDWPFGSVRHMDESPIGAWRLEVTDAVNADTGTWNRWSIRFWGRP